MKTLFLKILCLDFEKQGFHSHPCPTSEHKDIFEHVLVEPLPQLDMKPYFFEEKTKPKANHLPLKKRFVWKGDSTTTSTNCATPTSNCAMHDSICATPASDFEKALSNSITSDSPSNEVVFNSEFVKVCNSFAVPSCVEGRFEIKCSKDYSPKPFLHSRTAPEPTSSSKKVPSQNFSSQETSFASEGITSCLSSLHKIEFEFETFLLQEEVRKLKSPSSSSLKTFLKKNLSLQDILKLIQIAPSFKDHKSILSLIVRA